MLEYHLHIQIELGSAVGLSILPMSSLYQAWWRARLEPYLWLRVSVEPCRNNFSDMWLVRLRVGANCGGNIPFCYEAVSQGQRSTHWWLPIWGHWRVSLHYHLKCDEWSSKIFHKCWHRARAHDVSSQSDPMECRKMSCCWINDLAMKPLRKAPQPIQCWSTTICAYMLECWSATCVAS